MTTTPKALPAKVSIDEDVRVLREAVDAVPRLEWTYGAGVVTIPETEEDNSEGRINFRAILNKLVAPKFGRFVSAASPARIARLLAAVESLRGNAPVADSLASAGGVEVVGYIWKFSNQDEEIVFLDSARIAWREDEPKPVSQVELVAKDAHLAALSKEREVAEGLAEVLGKLCGAIDYEAAVNCSMPLNFQKRAYAADQRFKVVDEAKAALTAHRESRGAASEAKEG